MTRRCVSPARCKRERQPLEERLGAAMRLPGHRLQQPAVIGISASNCAATSSQLKPCWRSSAPRAAPPQRVVARAARSPRRQTPRRHAATRPVTPSTTRSATRAERLHHRRHAQRLRLGERQAEGLAGIAAIEHRPAPPVSASTSALAADRRVAAHALGGERVGARQHRLHRPRLRPRRPRHRPPGRQ